MNWESETLFNDGDHFFEAFEHAMEKATRSIHVETYIFALDTLGHKIINLLEAASRRGVEVKVLLDGIGSSSWTHHDAEKLKRTGIEIRFFHPLIWQRPSIALRIPKLGLINHRNHRKLYVIDGKTAFVGSMNICDDHLKSVKKEKAWRDTSVMLSGHPVSALQDSFFVAWAEAAEVKETRKRMKRFLSKLKRPILLKHTFEQRQNYLNMLISKINHTQSHIWITTPYFVPNRSVLNAILDAAKRGVDVQCLFPKEGDFFGVSYATNGYYLRLLTAGVKVYEYLPSMLHAKILILDKFVSIGSSNLNHRSFFRDLEMDVILRRPETLKLLHSQFEDDLKHCRQITLERWKQRPFWRKLMEKFCFLFRGVL